MNKSILFLIAVAVIVIFAFIKIITHPGKFIKKVIINSAIGFVLLFIVNYIGTSFGLSIVVNVWTVLISGFFGIPGVVFLVLLTFL